MVERDLNKWCWNRGVGGASIGVLQESIGLPLDVALSSVTEC